MFRPQPAGDHVCHVTWRTPDDATKGLARKATSGAYLHRSVAAARETASGGRSKVRNHTGDTISGKPVDHNKRERWFCEGPRYNPRWPNA